MPPLLADALFWVAVACCAVAELLILRSVFASRPGAATAGGSGALPRVRRPLEVVWAIVPAVALALVLAATWRALHPDASGSSSPTRAPAPPRAASAGALA